MIDFRGRINAVTMVYVPHLTSINPPDMNFHSKKMLQPDILRTNVELLAAATHFQISMAYK